MNTSALVHIILLATSTVGCLLTPPGDTHPFAGPLPTGTMLDLSGNFELSRAGELTLTLRKGCTAQRTSPDGNKTANLACSAAERNAISVVAVPPWKTKLPGTWSDSRRVVFQVDWAKTNLDVLSADAVDVAAQPWTVSGVVWQPTPEEAVHILRLVGAATETENEIAQGGEAPKLEVASFEAPDGLRAGASTKLVVKIANHGAGAAYRVLATTRSSMKALHGHRLAFGAIQPGTEKTRRVVVEVPSGERSPDAMVVLVVSEGNGFVPSNMSRRWQIAIAEPQLSVHCAIPEHSGTRPEIAAGTRITIRCAVDNSGSGAATAELEASINGAATIRSKPQEVPPSKRTSFVASLVIPRDLPMKSAIQIGINVRDTRLGGAVQTALHATVGKPKLCDVGKLTRAQYEAKVVELRATVASGDMSQAQLDRYDAELILCLQ